MPRLLPYSNTKTNCMSMMRTGSIMAIWVSAVDVAQNDQLTLLPSLSAFPQRHPVRTRSRWNTASADLNSRAELIPIDIVKPAAASCPAHAFGGSAYGLAYIWLWPQVERLPASRPWACWLSCPRLASSSQQTLPNPRAWSGLLKCWLMWVTPRTWHRICPLSVAMSIA